MAKNGTLKPPKKQETKLSLGQALQMAKNGTLKPPKKQETKLSLGEVLQQAKAGTLDVQKARADSVNQTMMPPETPDDAYDEKISAL